MSNRLLAGDYDRLPIIRQSEAAECGLACLAMVASFYGNKLDLNTLRRRHPISLNGVTLRNLIQIAGDLHLSTRALRFEIEHIQELRAPAILHWDMNHFVVLKSASARGIVVHDPAMGIRFLTYSEASRHVTGVALEIIPGQGFTKKDERTKLPLSIFFQHARGLKQPFAQLIGLSILLELLFVAAPFYMQLTVDEVIARSDQDLLSVLALGFLLLTLITVGAKMLRSQIILAVENVIHFQMGSQLFRHLLRLPLVWFEKRHVGDILSRFTSLEPIQKLISEGLIAGVLDGVMAIITLGMIFYYSGILAAVVLIALTCYIIVRVALYRMFHQRNEASIQAHALENTNFIETVRALQSVKLFNKESERETQWLNKYADVINANVRLGRAKISFETINGIIFGLENILTVYIAARLALSNSLSIGMVFAFMSFKAQFIQ
ncbi:MAG: peptidase domain-containing ABC transporter, partial [Hyphomicrobium sp.]